MTTPPRSTTPVPGGRSRDLLVFVAQYGLPPRRHGIPARRSILRSVAAVDVPCGVSTRPSRHLAVVGDGDRWREGLWHLGASGTAHLPVITLDVPDARVRAGVGVFRLRARCDVYLTRRLAGLQALRCSQCVEMGTSGISIDENKPP